MPWTQAEADYMRQQLTAQGVSLPPSLSPQDMEYLSTSLAKKPGQPEEVSLAGAFKTGLRESPTGMILKGLPEEETRHFDFWDKVARGIGSFVDPISLATFFIGGGVGGAAARKLGVEAVKRIAIKTAAGQGAKMAGALGMHAGSGEAIRQAAADEGIDLSEIAKKTGKGIVTGAALGPAAAIPGVGLLGKLGRFGAESAVFGAVPPALEDRLPTAEEMALAPATLGILKGATAPVPRVLRGIEARAGRKAVREATGEQPLETAMELQRAQEAAEAPRGAFEADPTVPVEPAPGREGFVRLGAGERPPTKVQKPWLSLDKTKSPDKDVEGFFERTADITAPTSVLKRVGSRLGEGLREKFVTMRHIPKTPEAAFARDAIRTMPEQTRSSLQKAIDDLNVVLQGRGNRKALDSAGVDLLRRKVFVEDMLTEARRAVEAGQESISRLPKGLTQEKLVAEKARIDDVMGRVPSIRDAYEMRQELWSRVSSDLVERGVLPEEALQNPTYVRHFVMDYLEQTGYKAGRRRLQEPYRPYAKQRKGTQRDTSTDYLEVELRALNDIYRDNMIHDLAEQVATRYALDVKPEAAPEGYVPWQFKRGNIFYRARTLVDKEISKLLEETVNDPEVLAHIKLDPSQFREALVMGGKRKQYVLPEWLAKQLDDLPIRSERKYAASLVTPVTQAWKRWILRTNPIRYNKRNFLGDSERINAAGWTGAFKRFPESARRLYQKSSPEAHPEAYQRGQEYGVFGTTLWYDMGSATMLKEFEPFREAKIRNYSEARKFADRLSWVGKKGLERYDAVTQFREDIPRFAVYLEALDAVEAHLRTGKPLRHWAGSRGDIEALAKADKYRAAAKISRETVGDYGDFTPWENDALRNGLIPFYSWMKINTVFWPKVFKNAAADVGPKGAAGIAVARAGQVGWNVSKWMARISAAYGAIHLWNTRDEEARRQEAGLDPWLRGKPHLNLPGGVFYEPSALSDFLEWFDLQEIAVDLRRWERGQITTEGLVLAVMKNEARAPVNRVFMGLTPYLKAGLTSFGMRTFPDIFDARPFAESFSSEAVSEAILDILGSDVRRFLDIAGGRRTPREVFSYYFSGSSWRSLTPDVLEKRIYESLDRISLKRPSPATGRAMGEAKKGRQREQEELQNRLREMRGN